MRIVHCIFSLNTGGTETMLIDLLNEQSKSHRVTLIILNKSYEYHLLSQISSKIKVYTLNRTEGNRSIFPIIKLNFILFKLRPQVIHIHNHSFPKIILFKNKLIYTAHCLDIPTTYFNQIKHIVAISNAVKENILQRQICPITTITNGIPINSIKKKNQYSIDSSFKIIQVGRLDITYKGQDILIKAIELLRVQGFNNIQVDFIGTGKSEQLLKDLVHNLNLDHQINFLGLRDRNYIYNHLHEYHLMCHPSRSEGFGLTIAEGIAAKIPVLVSNADGPFEIIEHGKYGFAFQKENVEDCAKQIKNIIIHYNTVQQLCDSAYLHVKNSYSIEKTAKKYINLYHSLT